MKMDPLELGRPTDRDSAKRIKRWARQLLSVEDSDTLMVTELRCSEEGCPPRETVIAIMNSGGARQLKIPKDLRDVTESDIRSLSGPTGRGPRAHP